MTVPLTCLNFLQIDPDDRPAFEEILEFLESIQLPEEPEDDDKEPQSPQEPEIIPRTPEILYRDRDLRQCISEPFIRLNDVDIPDDESRSCGSEEELRLIIDHRIPHRERLLDSLGSSAESSCGLSVPEEEGEEGVSLADMTCSTTITAPEKIGQEVEVGGSGKAAEPHSETTISESDDTASTSNKSCPVPGPERSNRLLRRTSDGTLHVEGMSNRHRGAALQKSNSLNIEASDELKRQAFSSSPSSQPFSIPLASRVRLNSSVQTLVDEDSVAPYGSSKGGGGDSGIDPGDMEVFKFPLPGASTYPTQTYSMSADVSRDQVELSCDQQGDSTPVCTSPNLNPVKSHIEYDTPISKGVATNESHDQFAAGSNSNAFRTSPSHSYSQFSFSGTSSDEMTDFDSQNFVTPSGQCVSPFARSWASSEFSFNLPTPSTPWAPPSSPIPPHTPHSLPTSPTHCCTHLQSNNTAERYHRKSVGGLLYPSSNNISSCLRKTSSSSDRRPHSCRNSALFPDLGTDNGRDFDDFKQKSVHFVDIKNGAKLCPDRNYPNDYGDLSPSKDPLAMGSGRPRSKSIPQNPMRTNFEMMGGVEDRAPDGGDIRLKTDWSNKDPHSCKCYKIAQRSNTRLSSSTPDLSKLLSPLQFIHSSTGYQ